MAPKIRRDTCKTYSACHRRPKRCVPGTRPPFGFGSSWRTAHYNNVAAPHQKLSTRAANAQYMCCVCCEYRPSGATPIIFHHIIITNHMHRQTHTRSVRTRLGACTGAGVFGTDQNTHTHTTREYGSISIILFYTMRYAKLPARQTKHTSNEPPHTITMSTRAQHSCVFKGAP